MVGCIDNRMDRVLNLLIEAKPSSFRKRKKEMLNCTTCNATVEVLAYQIRNGQEVAVCLDCADRYFQAKLTGELIANEKVGA
jgi:hypothetical protein